MAFYGLDVSQYQGEINWNQVKSAGKVFAMIRIGWCGYDGTLVKDPTFERNLSQAGAAGMETGVYLYSYARSQEAMVTAARQVLTELRGKTVTYPVALDFEDRLYQSNSRELNTSLAKAFLETIQEGNYFAQLYTYTSFANTWLNMADLKAYSFWLADYSEKPSYTGTYAMWQYTGSGSVRGITGPVDLDVSYQDFARIIQNAGLNQPKEETPPSICDDQLQSLQQQLAAAKEDLQQVRQQLDQIKEGLEDLLKKL